MLINKILYYLSGNLKCKLIKGDYQQPYLERYMLIRWGKNGQHTLFLHRFLDSDSDKGIHDHPWDSKGFILLGGYNEKRLIKENGIEKVIVRNVKPLSFNNIGKNDFHQIMLKPKTPTWTIFYHGPRVKHWGFQYYEIKENQEIKKTEFLEYEDKTNPEEHWETTALKGKNLKREKENYIMVK